MEQQIARIALSGVPYSADKLYSYLVPPELVDACRAGVLSEDDVPFSIRYRLGNSPAERINTLVSSVIEASGETIAMTPEIGRAADELRTFMFETVYHNPLIRAEAEKAEDMLCRLYEYYMKHGDELPPLYRENIARDGLAVCVADYVSGMTDRFAVETYKNLYIPAVWQG